MTEVKSEEVSVSNKAVVVADGRGLGCILWHSGKMVEHMSTAKNWDEAGFEDAPHGIHVWEGTIEFDGPVEDPENEVLPIHMQGAYRKPTREEWACLGSGLNPFLEVNSVVPYIANASSDLTGVEV